jgi:predicted tellurium resistance membrane protein TerC
MITAVVISVLIMMQFAVPVGSFVNKTLRYKFWVCPFLILIMLKVLIYQMLTLGNHVTPVPKGYLYFAISFSLMVEVINMKASKKKKEVKRFFDSRPSSIQVK